MCDVLHNHTNPESKYLLLDIHVCRFNAGKIYLFVKQIVH